MYCISITYPAVAMKFIYSLLQYKLGTAGFIKTVPSVYTLLTNTIYLSMSTQVAEVTGFFPEN